ANGEADRDEVEAPPHGRGRSLGGQFLCESAKRGATDERISRHGSDEKQQRIDGARYSVSVREDGSARPNRERVAVRLRAQGNNSPKVRDVSPWKHDLLASSVESSVLSLGSVRPSRSS